MLIIQSNKTCHSILFDHLGNAEVYQEFTLGDDVLKNKDYDEVLVNEKGEIVWCIDIIEEG